MTMFGFNAQYLHVNRAPGIFITGTDTGVGKTYFGTTLARSVTLLGGKICPRKPIESGCTEYGGVLTPNDAIALQYASNFGDNIDVICAFRLKAIASPERALLLERRSVLLDELVRAAQRDLDDCDFWLVEGAGGWLSPICSGGTNADLAMALGLPVVAVVADRLGCLNHALLTISDILYRSIPLAGIVLSQPEDSYNSHLNNIEDLRRWLGCQINIMPYSPGLCSELNQPTAISKELLYRIALGSYLAPFPLNSRS